LGLTVPYGALGAPPSAREIFHDPLHLSLRQTLEAGDQYAGQTTHCLYCNRELTIPGVEAVQNAAALPPANPPGGERRPPQSATSGMAIASVILGILSLYVGFFAGVPAIILGVLGLRAIGKDKGRFKGKGIAIAGLVTGAFGSLAPIVLLMAVQRLRDAADRAVSKNNLMQIGLAMHNYADSRGTLPAAARCDAQGKPLLSWRVTLLRYIEQEALYQQFKLDEPWDGPNNIKLLPLMPKDYALRDDKTTPPGYTHYRVFVGNGAAFDPPRPSGPAGETPGTPPDAFTNGKANMILIVDAATAVPWTKPEDLDYDPNGPLPPLGGHFSDGFHVLMGDYSVRMIPKLHFPRKTNISSRITEAV
jgi:Protein of unknown function (DUF1559)/Domain of unknown function (DUF4190)